MYQKNNNNNVYIIQQVDRHIELFMLKPFIDNISKLFKHSRCLYNQWKITDFKENDIIICIGCSLEKYFKEF